MIMLIKDTIPFIDNTAALPQSADPHLEQHGISITMQNRQHLHIHNIFIRHVAVAALVTIHRPRTSSATKKCCLLLGMLMRNAPYGMRTQTKTTNGEHLADVIHAVDCTILSEIEATLLPTNGRTNSPDISWPPMTSDWSVSTSLAIDHLPILITIDSELSTIDGPRRTYINFMKANWARYAEAYDEYLAEAGETRTVEHAEKTLRKALNKASGLYIQPGRIQHFQPSRPASVKSLTDERGNADNVE